jgi:hypothetical protein
MFNPFNLEKSNKKNLDNALKQGLITYEEKLRLEAERSANRLDKFLSKKNRKKK